MPGACLEALLTWFRDDTAAEIIKLKASPDGANLYAAPGFRSTHRPKLRLTITNE